MNRMPTTIMVVIATVCLVTLAYADPPYQATGIKIGEVTDSQAIIWTRLTRHAERIGDDAPMPRFFYKNPDTGELIEEPNPRKDWEPVVQYPEGIDIDGIEGATPGTPGEVRVLYRTGNANEWMTTDWGAVDPERDFTHQFLLSGLQPATRYEIRVESREAATGNPGQTVEGIFRTAPVADAVVDIDFVVTTCHEYMRKDSPEGFRLYPAMQKLDPDFFVHTGDIVYYDRMAKTLPLAHWHWARIYSLPNAVNFHRQVASYFIKDDHDTLKDDCWPGMHTIYMGDFTFEQGLAVFREQVPMGDSTYRTYRWGKDLQIWLVEGRDYRTPNNIPDGPDKTIWGSEQKAWFKRTVRESDAAFRILISPTPLVGPDRDNKNDNHSNKGFSHEGRELRGFIAAQRNMVVINGDRHWQYVSVDDETGLREYSCGPGSDEHAGGWSQDDVRPQHQFLKVAGGFLAVSIIRTDGVPTMFLRHYDVDGGLRHEDCLVAH